MKKIGIMNYVSLIFIFLALFSIILLFIGSYIFSILTMLVNLIMLFVSYKISENVIEKKQERKRVY